MERPIDIAEHAVASYAEGLDDQYSRCLHELEMTVRTPQEAMRCLAAAGLPLEHLRRAAEAAAQGDAALAATLRARACCLVGEEEVLALAEEHRLSFTVHPSTVEIPRRPKLGFAS